MSDKRAVILAGGKGTRLKPYTINLPKPLVPVGGVPILEIIVRQLKQYGFTHITMAVSHMAEVIRSFFSDGSDWGMQIDYSLEYKPLSTMGPLKLLENLPENFLVMNVDNLTDLNYSDFFDTHINARSAFSIAGYKRQQKVDFGVLEVNSERELIGFQEKPVFEYFVSMGVYILNRSVLELIPDNTSYGFDQLMLKMIKNKQPVLVEPFQGYWLDIGRPEDYEEACNKSNMFVKDIL